MQARRQQQSPRMTGCQWSFNDLKCLCTTAPILAYANPTKPLKLHTNTCGCGLGAVLYQIHDDRTNATIAYTSRMLTKAETHYPTHKLEFLTLKWAVVEKFHEYLYGLTFNIYTENNPLMYILMTAKMDTASHHWVASLANYKFQLYYRAGKTNTDADTLLRVSWLGCVPDTLDTHHQVTAVAVEAMQEATLEGSVSPIGAYSWGMCVLDLIGDSQQVACMTTDDWHQAQGADPVLGLAIVRMQDGTLGQYPFKLTDPPKL